MIKFVFVNEFMFKFIRVNWAKNIDQGLNGLVKEKITFVKFELLE